MGEKQTYIIRSRTDEPQMSQELPITAAEQPYNKHLANLAVFNPTGSNKIIYVKKMRATEQTSFNPFATLGQFELRIVDNVQSVPSSTFYTGGAADSLNPSTPAGLTVFSNISSFDFINSVPIRRLIADRSFTNVLTTGFPVARRTPATSMMFDWVGGAEVQKFVIPRNNNNKALCLTINTTLLFPSFYSVSFAIRHVQSNSVWYYEFILPVVVAGSGTGVDPIRPLFAIKNTDAVANYEILNFALTDVSIAENLYNEVTIEKIDGFVEGATLYEDPMILGLDSTNTFHTSVIMKQDVVVFQGGTQRYGRHIVLPLGNAIRHIVQYPMGVLPNKGRTGWGLELPAIDSESGYEFTLREGDGIAWMTKREFGFPGSNYMMTLVIEDVTPTGGGGAVVHGFV